MRMCGKCAIEFIRLFSSGLDMRGRKGLHLCFLCELQSLAHPSLMYLFHIEHSAASRNGQFGGGGSLCFALFRSQNQIWNWEITPYVLLWLRKGMWCV